MNGIEPKSDVSSTSPINLNLTGATVSLENDINSESDSDDNRNIQFPKSVIPNNTNLNVENSSDVVVGTITQFHGPVTIYQNTHNGVLPSESQNCVSHFCTDGNSVTTNTNSVANLVTADILPRKQLPNLRKLSSSKKQIIIYSLTALTVALLICVIIGILAARAFYDKVNELPAFEENKSQIQGSKHVLIDRDRWGGRPPLYVRPMKHPVKYVIISHTAGTWCDSIPSCSIQMQQIQSYHVSEFSSPDIGYNFVIGGDANIYMGRGWDAHNFHMNLDTIGICFIGNYIYDVLTPGMIEAAQQLLNYGVEHGKLDKDYNIYAHNQTFKTQSPGPNIYNQIKFWPHFTPDFLQDIN